MLFTQLQLTYWVSQQIRNVAAVWGRMRFLLCLELGVARVPREGDHIADVLHARAEEDEALKPKAESGVHTGAISAEVKIPAIIRRIQLELVHAHVKHLKARRGSGSSELGVRVRGPPCGIHVRSLR